MFNGFRFSDRLDRTHLDMMYEDDLERASLIFQIFANNVKDEIALLKKLEAEKSDEEFIKKVHKVVPNFAMVGLTAETEVLAAIESEAKADGVSLAVREKFRNFVAQLDEKLEIVFDELNRINNHLQQ